MGIVSHWLGAASHRVVVLNISMLILLLALVGSGALFALVGGLCLLVAGFAGLRRAIGASVRRGDGRRAAFDRVLVWLPGAAALVLGALGLHLVVNAPAGSALQLAGMLLFGFELVMLVVPADGKRSPATDA